LKTENKSAIRPPSGQRQDIQILRGVAILLVVGYHIGIDFFKNGFLGVDIFFVISGYLMAQMYQTNSSREFLWKRAMRLLPSYFVTIICTLIVASVLTVPSDFIQSSNQVVYSLLLVPNFYFWMQNSYFAVSDFNPLLHLWSLGIEIQFYLLVPLLVYIFTKSKRLLLFLGLISLVLSLIAVQVSPKTSFFLLPFRIWEFLFGFTVGRVSLTHPIRGRSLSLRVITNCFLAVSFYLIFFFDINGFSTSPIFGHPGLSALVVTISISLVLFQGKQISKSLMMRPLHVLGDYSYALYLVHFPVLVFLGYSAFDGTNLDISGIRQFALSIILIGSLTVTLHWCIERPMRYLKFNRGGVENISWQILLLLVLAVISYAYNNNKFTNYEKRVSLATLDRDQYRCGKINRLLSPFEEICHLVRSSSDKKLLLLGNSHADSLKSAVVAEAKRLNFDLYFWVQNDPLMYSPSDLEKVISEIKENKIGYVLLHYSNGALSANSLKDFVYQTSSRGVVPFVVGPVPTWPKSVPALVWSSKEFEPRLIQDYSKFQRLNPQSLLLESQSKELGISYYDLAKFMCSPYCKYSLKNGTPIYFDSNHLNLEGARTVQSFLGNLIETEMNMEGK
jgi:peptidoglycan/LPS O-acetylase OafA/YrhL